MRNFTCLTYRHSNAPHGKQIIRERAREALDVTGTDWLLQHCLSSRVNHTHARIAAHGGLVSHLAAQSAAAVHANHAAERGVNAHLWACGGLANFLGAKIAHCRQVG